MDKRHAKMKSKVKGTLERPRLSVYRSRTEIYVQVIDDVAGHTLASASSLKLKKGSDSAAAEKVGEAIAKEVLDKKIKKVVFDRGTRPYKGRIKVLAEAARKTGLEF